MTNPDPAGEPIPTYKLPFETCAKFRTATSRTEELSDLDVRLGLQKVMDDPQFFLTAELRGQRFAVPDYVKILAKWVYDAQTGGPSAEGPLNFEGMLVPDEVQQILNGGPDQEETLF